MAAASCVPASAEGKSGGKPCAAAMPAKASWMMRPHASASSATAGRMLTPIPVPPYSDRRAAMPGPVPARPGLVGSDVAAREPQDRRGHARALGPLHQIAQHVLALRGTAALDVAQHRGGERAARLVSMACRRRRGGVPALRRRGTRRAAPLAPPARRARRGRRRRSARIRPGHGSKPWPDVHAIAAAASPAAPQAMSPAPNSRPTTGPPGRSFSASTKQREAGDPGEVHHAAHEQQRHQRPAAADAVQRRAGAPMRKAPAFPSRQCSARNSSGERQCRRQACLSGVNWYRPAATEQEARHDGAAGRHDRATAGPRARASTARPWPPGEPAPDRDVGEREQEGARAAALRTCGATRWRWSRIIGAALGSIIATIITAHMQHHDRGVAGRPGHRHRRRPSAHRGRHVHAGPEST